MAFHDLKEVSDFINHVMNLDGKLKPWANQIFKEKIMHTKPSYCSETLSNNTSSDEEDNSDSDDENIFTLFENKLEDKFTSSKFFKEKMERLKNEKMFEESVKKDSLTCFNTKSKSNISSKGEICQVPKNKSYTSYISMQLDNMVLSPCEEILNPFEDYCKYINMGPNHISINIVLPFVESGKNCIVIECLKDIEISNLIGLICYKYTLKNYKPPLKEIYYYELKIAHNLNDIYYDLPSLDVTKKFCDSSFDNLALIDITLLGDDITKNVTVYTYDAKPYSITLPSYNVPLRMVRDKSLDMAQTQLGLNKKIDGIDLCEIEYVLQKLDDPSINLDLKMPLFQVNCDKFVLLRQNSTRGNFSSVYEKKKISSSILRSGTMNNSKSLNTIDNSLPTISEMFDFQEPEVCSISEDNLKDSKYIASFEIDRLTHLKFKKTELLEIMENHIRFISQRSSKTSLIIPWELLAHFALLKEHNDVSLYKIVWMKFDHCLLNSNTKSSITPSDSKNFLHRIYKRRNSHCSTSPTSIFQSNNTLVKFSFHYDLQFFDENIISAKWKSLNIELPNHYSSSIANYMYSIENNLSALVYKYSEDGRLPPIEAWEKYKKNQNSSNFLNNL